MDPLIRALKACGNRHRLRMLKAILEAGGASRQHDLVEELGIPQFLAARYLQLLVDAGLLHRIRRGLPVRYRVARAPAPPLRRLLRLIRSLPLELFNISGGTLEKLAKSREGGRKAL